MASKHSGGEDFIDEMFGLFKAAPWWFGPIGIAFFFALFAWVLPLMFHLIDASIESQIKIGTGLATISIMFAPWIALGVMLIWLAALVGKLFDNQRIDSQRGLPTIRDLPWREFEQLLATAYRRKGYRVTDTGTALGPGSPDGGIDLILERDHQRILVQCKQWKARKVGVKIARELYGLVASQNATAGILITSGSYTRDAQDFAQNLPLDLIDGPQLETLIRSVQRDKLATSQQAKLQGNSGAKPTTAPTQAAPACPLCQSPMIQRTARRGANAGNQFWGCSSYPKCRGTKSM